MLHIKPHCFFRPYGLCDSDLRSFTAIAQMLQSAFLKVTLRVSAQTFLSSLQDRNNKPSVMQNLGCYNQRENWMKKKWTSRADFVSNSLFSSTSPSLSLHGTYLRLLPSTTVVTTCEETIPTTSFPATVTLAALATHHLEITSSFVNTCLVVRPLGT